MHPHQVELPQFACPPTFHGQLERIAARGWRGVEEEPLGEWLLRAGHGFTGRANSALALGDPGVPLSEAVDRVRDWYAERGLPPTVQLPLPPSEPADEVFAAAGWVAANAAHVLLSDLPDLMRRTGDAAERVEVTVLAEPDAEWLGQYHYRGSALPPGAREVLVNAADVGFTGVRSDDRLVGVARGAVDGGWLGVTAVTVDPAYRRRGLGTALLHALGAWASGRADGVYLQVAPDNDVALRTYAAQGFELLHRYHYRVAPADD